MYSLLTNDCMSAFVRRTRTTTTFSRATHSTTTLRAASTYALHPHTTLPTIYEPTSHSL
jgi:hypothetical protein